MLIDVNQNELLRIYALQKIVVYLHRPPPAVNNDRSLTHRTNGFESS